MDPSEEHSAPLPSHVQGRGVFGAESGEGQNGGINLFFFQSVCFLPPIMLLKSYGAILYFKLIAVGRLGDHFSGPKSLILWAPSHPVIAVALCYGLALIDAEDLGKIRGNHVLASPPNGVAGPLSLK